MSRSCAPACETDTEKLVPFAGPMAVNPFGVRVQVEWEAHWTIPVLSQVPFFDEVLPVCASCGPRKVSCRLLLACRDASGKRDVPSTMARSSI